MTTGVGTPDWISKNNEYLRSLETEVSTQFLPFEFGIELKEDNHSFTLRIESTEVKLVPGITSSCEVMAKLSSQTAEQINQGEISVAEAISDGEIKISGNLTKLLESHTLLSQLAASLQRVLESTM